MTSELYIRIKNLNETKILAQKVSESLSILGMFCVSFTSPILRIILPQNICTSLSTQTVGGSSDIVSYSIVYLQYLTLSSPPLNHLYRVSTLLQ